MGTIGALVNKAPTSLQYKPAPELTLGSAYIGVEIEAENVNRENQLPASISCYWTQHVDDSLRNNGMEFSFTIPLFGTDAVNAIKGLCAYALKSRWVISQRTGLHVHLDVRDMEVDAMCRLLCVYALAEPALYKWIGDRREYNHFCLPWYTAQAGLKRAASAFLMPSREARVYLQDVHRYSGLNLQAVAKFGSIEFRQMKTTFNEERIFTWINIIMALKAYAVSSDIPLKRITDVATSGQDFLHLVFGEELARVLWYPQYEKDIVNYGVTSAEELLSGFTANEEMPKFGDIFITSVAENGKSPAFSAFMRKYKPDEAPDRYSVEVPFDTSIRTLGDLLRAETDAAGAEVLRRPPRLRPVHQIVEEGIDNPESPEEEELEDIDLDDEDSEENNEDTW